MEEFLQLYPEYRILLGTSFPFKFVSVESLSTFYEHLKNACLLCCHFAVFLAFFWKSVHSGDRISSYAYAQCMWMFLLKFHLAYI